MTGLSSAVKVTLDKERHLSYSFNALVSFEDETGEDLLTVFDRMAKGVRPSMKLLRAMVWCGLLHEDAELTPAQVGELLSFRTFAEIAPLMGEAISLALPPRDPDAENPRKAPAKQKQSIGVTSGA